MQRKIPFKVARYPGAEGAAFVGAGAGCGGGGGGGDDDLRYPKVFFLPTLKVR